MIKPESPIIGTGIEYRAAKDSGVCAVAKRDGVVSSVSSDSIRITDLLEKLILISYPST